MVRPWKGEGRKLGRRRRRRREEGNEEGEKWRKGTSDVSGEAGGARRILTMLRKTEEEVGLEEGRKDDGVKRIG